MNANRAKWYGIISTFVVGLLQTLLCYGVITLFFWNDFPRDKWDVWLEVFANFSDLFIPILFLVCFQWSKNIGERIILYKENAYKASIHHLNWMLTLAYMLTMFALMIGQVFKDGFERNIIIDIQFFISITFAMIAFGLIPLRLLNYIPSALGAIPLSRFLKRYQ